MCFFFGEGLQNSWMWDMRCEIQYPEPSPPDYLLPVSAIKRLYGPCERDRIRLFEAIAGEFFTKMHQNTNISKDRQLCKGADKLERNLFFFDCFSLL